MLNFMPAGPRRRLQKRRMLLRWQVGRAPKSLSQERREVLVLVRERVSRRHHGGGLDSNPRAPLYSITQCPMNGFFREIETLYTL